MKEQILESEGILLILSSPSGAGKTTISHNLLKQHNDLVKSISVTTRVPRFGEIEGKDYFFVTEEKFYSMCKSGDMLEYAKVFNNLYGIPKDFIEENIKKGISVLLNIDWQGAFYLSKIIKKNVVTIFILPPSMSELKIRLDNRNSDEEDVIKHRLIEAQNEIKKCFKYDYIIVNYDINKSTTEISSILNAEKLKTRRKANLKNFINNILVS
ncbi:guanylate kinase [Wolbachia endosymbiont of Pentidionis agamae]|uniref:guanylate kinase n=1 Tax=Wolbachia endosymbiont of Pentidionis agamae TaxID=3110435 RepID=UPI002FD0BA32